MATVSTKIKLDINSEEYRDQLERVRQAYEHFREEVDKLNNIKMDVYYSTTAQGDNNEMGNVN